MSEKDDVIVTVETNKVESPVGKAVPKMTEASSATEKNDSGCSESRLEHETRVRHYFDPLLNHCLAT